VNELVPVLDGDGLADLVTANNDLSGAGYDTVNILLQRPNHSFKRASGSPLIVGGASGPEAVTVADFNGDGLPDLVTTEYADDPNVSVVLQRSDHTFVLASGSPFPSGSSHPVAIVAADFDGDGLLDVATANPTSRNAAVLLQTPDRTFINGPGSPFTAGAYCPRSVAMADVNGDGRPDVITLNTCSWESTVSVLVQQTDHTFIPIPGSPYDVGGLYSTSVAVADMNGDGLQDIVTVNDGSDNVSVLLQRSDHTFSPADGSPFGVGGSLGYYLGSVCVVLTDLNGDGLIDVVTAGVSGTVALYQVAP